MGLDGPRLTEMLAAALDGSGPALLPLSAEAPTAMVRAQLAEMRPESVCDADGRHSADQRTPLPVDADTALVIPTSGSTGKPKGVELSAHALRHSTRASLQRIGAEHSRAPWLCVLPTNHIAGIQVLLRALATDAPVVHSPFDPVAVAEQAARHHPHVSLVPTQLRRLLEAEMDLSQFRSILLGGAAADRDLVRTATARGGRIHTTYGMSETCGGCVYSGYPLQGVEVALDSAGIIHLGGAMVCRGYRLAPELTAARISVQSDTRWLATSDVGSWDEQGRLQVHGRVDDVINSGGHKIVAEEVAARLRTHPKVAEAVVVGIADDEWGEKVLAWIVPHDTNRPPRLTELRDWVRGHLPGYAAPRELRVRSALPLLPSGKPDLTTLREG